MLRAFLLLLLCGSAQAFDQCVPKSTWTPFGSGTPWVFGRTSAPDSTVSVLRWAWWCPQADGTWDYYVIRCIEGRTCLSLWDATAELDTAMRSEKPLDQLASAVQRYSASPTADESSMYALAWYEAASAVAASKPALAASAPPTPLPPPTALIVGKATRADGTRPAYKYVNGKRTTTQVPPGAVPGNPCSQNGQFETTAAGTWAPFGPLFKPDVGTLCVRP